MSKRHFFPFCLKHSGLQAEEFIPSQDNCLIFKKIKTLSKRQKTTNNRHVCCLILPLKKGGLYDQY
ncbi:MAG TPA: hypothetical protein DEB50_02850 [Desulfobacter sp.]|nr:hypothetical protein [Desulfobacter sp.]